MKNKETRADFCEIKMCFFNRCSVQAHTAPNQQPLMHAVPSHCGVPALAERICLHQIHRDTEESEYGCAAQIIKGKVFHKV